MRRTGLFLLAALLAAAMPALAQSYVWTGATSSDWQVATNWNPNRNTPATSDSLFFNSGGPWTVTNIPTEHLYLLSVDGSITVNLQAGAASNSLNIQYLSVGAGSALNNTGANALLLSVFVSAQINGSMTFGGAAHKLQSTAAGGIQFNSGSSMTQDIGCTGNIFGTSGAADVAVFNPGSQFIQYAGSNPFGLTQPASKVVFMAGSWFRCRMSGSPAFSGRSYANFELDWPAFSANATGSNPTNIDTLLVTDGNLRLQLRHINIRGAIIVLDTLYFNSALSCSLYLNGTAQQTLDWSAANSFMLGSLTHVLVDNPADVALGNNNLVVNCKLHLLNGRVITGANQVSVTTDSAVVRANGYVLGNMWHQVNTGATVVKNYTVGNDSGYTPATLTFSNVTSSGGARVGITHDAHAGAAVPANTLRNYWTITPTGLSFVYDSCNAQFSYLSADFNTGFLEATDEGTMAVGKYDTGTWTFPTITARDTAANTIDISGLTSFSDFTMGKDQAAFVGAPDTIAPSIVWTSPAWNAVDVGLNEPIVVAFSEPMNTGSVDGYPSGNSFTLSWNAGGDTLTLTPQYSYQYNTVYWIIVTAGTDLAGNPLPVLPDTIAHFTTIPNQGPEILMVQTPGDTYDGSGPFTVRAVIADPVKAGIAADTLWYTDNAANWWSLSHASIEGDTFSYSIAGPFVPGTIIEYFFGAWDDAGAVQYDPGMYRGYQFRILDPLPPTTLSATGLDMAVDLSWAPPAQVIGYSNWAPAWYYYWGGGDIATTRFSPQHYPCRLEQAVAMFYDAGSGMDSVEVHVWADNGEGLPDLLTELVPPFRVMPEVYPTATVVDLSGYNLVLAGGDFHVGYVCLYESKSNPLTDGGGSGVRSIFHDALMGTWGNLIIGGDYCNWLHQAVVTYSSYTKGLALKSYKPRKTDKPLPATTGLKAVPVVNKRAPVYPKLTGALAMAKYCNGYTILRGDAPGGPYTAIGSSGNPPSYLDDAVTNGTPYYYVVRAEYSTPDTFSVNSNEATATAAALPILLVDDDGSWNGFVDVQAEYTAALDAAGQSGNYTVFDAQFDGDGPDSVWMSGRTHVIWATGETYGDGDDSTLTPANEAVLAAFLNAGGRLFLSAQDYLYDAYNSAGYFTAGQFPYDYLGVDSANQDISEDTQFDVAGVGLSLADGQAFTVSTLPTYMYPDELIRRTEALDVFDVTAKVGEKVGVQYSNGTFRTVFFAMPFENLVDGSSPNTKGELMYRILNWLTTGVEANPAADLSKPAAYSLAANYPNPVRGATTVKFALPKAGRVSIGVYNVMGQKVKTLVDGTMNAGYHAVSWNGRNESGQAVSAGVYLYRMQADNFSTARKLVVVR